MSKYFGLIFLVFAWSSGYCQKLKAIDRELAKKYLKVLDWGIERRYEQYSRDYAEEASSDFGEAIQKYIAKFPSTLTYPFTALDSQIAIATSEDKLFRIYSWDTWSGGSMHFHDILYQYRAIGKVKVFKDTIDDGGAKGYYSEIYSLNEGGKTYYLAVRNSIYSNRDVAVYLKAFTIDGERLVDTVRLFRTEEGDQNELGVPFNFFSVVDRPERPIKIFDYDPKQRIILVPIIDEHESVTEKFDRYEFREGVFQKEQ